MQLELFPGLELTDYFRQNVKDMEEKTKSSRMDKTIQTSFYKSPVGTRYWIKEESFESDLYSL